MRTRTSRTLLAAIAAGVMALPTSGSAAGTPVIVAGPGSTYATFTQPVAVAQKGDDVMFIHADPTGQHDVVSEQFGPDTADHCFRRNIPFPALGQPYDPSKGTFVLDAQGKKIRAFPVGACPMIYTALIVAAQQYPIEGLDNVVPGTVYDFICTIHPNMFGVLAVPPEA